MIAREGREKNGGREGNLGREETEGEGGRNGATGAGLGRRSESRGRERDEQKGKEWGGGKSVQERKTIGMEGKRER